MENLRDELSIGIGSEVTCLFGDARLKNSANLTVSSEVPLYFDCAPDDVKGFVFPREVVLIYQEKEDVLRGVAEVISAEDLPNGRRRLQFSKVVWENIDRRQYPRIDVEIPVKIRAVYESKEETVISVSDGKTLDISVGGSKVMVEHPVMKGSLVEFSAQLSELDSIRALGLVVFADESEGMIRIAFMDYLGATRSKLQEFTKRAAA